ncbi:MAG TPA: DUF4271 domain-containing protein [Flavisolibacter sp.]
MRYFFLVILATLCFSASGQQDSVPPPTDSPRAQPVRPRPRPRIQQPVVPRDTTMIDSLVAQPIVMDTIPPIDSAFFRALQPWHPDSIWVKSAYSFTDPTRIMTSRVEHEGKESIFYSLIGLLIFFALIRNSSGRYLQELVDLFFRRSVKQRQMKDPLLQNPLASLLLNIFYVLSGAMFIALLIQHFSERHAFNFWMLFAYGVLGLILIYSVKYLVLKLMGWIFQLAEAVDTYIFIVFTTNKIIGIALLPFVVVLSFTTGSAFRAVLTTGLVVLGGLFAYRYFLSYVSIHRKVDISFFHFMLYLGAFEIAPLLLINKLLLTFLDGTY